MPLSVENQEIAKQIAEEMYNKESNLTYQQFQNRYTAYSQSIPTFKGNKRTKAKTKQAFQSEVWNVYKEVRLKGRGGGGGAAASAAAAAAPAAAAPPPPPAAGANQGLTQEELNKYGIGNIATLSAADQRTAWRKVGTNPLLDGVNGNSATAAIVAAIKERERTGGGGGSGSGGGGAPPPPPPAVYTPPSGAPAPPPNSGGPPPPPPPPRTTPPPAAPQPGMLGRAGNAVGSAVSAVAGFGKAAFGLGQSAASAASSASSAAATYVGIGGGGKTPAPAPAQAAQAPTGSQSAKDRELDRLRREAAGSQRAERVTEAEKRRLKKELKHLESACATAERLHLLRLNSAPVALRL